MSEKKRRIEQKGLKLVVKLRGDPQGQRKLYGPQTSF